MFSYLCLRIQTSLNVVIHLRLLLSYTNKYILQILKYESLVLYARILSDIQLPKPSALKLSISYPHSLFRFPIGESEFMVYYNKSFRLFTWVKPWRVTKYKTIYYIIVYKSFPHTIILTEENYNNYFMMHGNSDSIFRQ